MTSVGTVISYPIPNYQNLPINSDWYTPSRFVISAVTRGNQTIVTTSTDHNYVIGQQVRLIIPPSFGIRQLNETSPFVVAIPASDEVLLDIDSSRMDAYIASSAATPAQIIAIGDIGSGAINSNGSQNQNLNIPGSFINISP